MNGAKAHSQHYYATTNIPAICFCKKPTVQTILAKNGWSTEGNCRNIELPTATRLLSTKIPLTGYKTHWTAKCLARYESLTVRYEVTQKRLDELTEARNDAMARGVSRFLAGVLAREQIRPRSMWTHSVPPWIPSSSMRRESNPIHTQSSLYECQQK